MSKTPQLALSNRGHAFLVVLKKQLNRIDDSDSEIARPALNDLGFDDQCLLAIQDIYHKKGILDTLRWLQSESFALSALFVVMNNAGRTCDKPLSGLLSYVLQETLVLCPLEESQKEESITDICVPWFNENTIEENHFYALEDAESVFSESQEKHVYDIILGRLKEAFTTKLKNDVCPRGQTRTFVIDCQGPLTEDAEYDIFLKLQIRRALQKVVSSLNNFQIKKVAGVYYLADQDYSEIQEDRQKFDPAIYPEDGAALESESLKNVRLTLFKLSAKLARPKNGRQFIPDRLDEEVMKQFVADPAFDEKKPSTYFVDQYLKALQDATKCSEEANPPVVGRYADTNRSPTQSMKQLASHKSMVWSSHAFFKKKKAVLLSVSIVPVLLGAVVGLCLGASGAISVSFIPGAFASMGAMGFGIVAGIVAGVGLAVVLLMISGPVLAGQERRYQKPVKRSVTAGFYNPFIYSRLGPDEFETTRDKLSELVDI